jgi:hypothetical protein
MKKMVAVLVNKLKCVFGGGNNPYGFKTHAEAWQKANKESPVSRELLKEVGNMHNYPLRTKDDFRWFVLFNYINTIDAKLDRSKENSFLQRVQQNIRISAEKYLS